MSKLITTVAMLVAAVSLAGPASAEDGREHHARHHHRPVCARPVVWHGRTLCAVSTPLVPVGVFVWPGKVPQPLPAPGFVL